MRHLNSKSAALLAAVGALAVLAGCGGGSSDSPSTTTKTPSASAGATTAEKPASTPRENSGGKPKKRAAGKKERRASKDAAGAKKSPQEKAHDLVKKLANSGKPVQADSPVGKKLLQALIQAKGANQGKGGRGKHKAGPVEKALEAVVSPNEGGNGGSSSSGGGGNGGSVAKVLEQLTE